MRITSPFCSSCCRTRWSLTKTPLRLFRSTTCHRPSRQTKRQCRRLTSGSGRRTSASLWRPRMTSGWVRSMNSPPGCMTSRSGVGPAPRSGWRWGPWTGRPSASSAGKGLSSMTLTCSGGAAGVGGSGRPGRAFGSRLSAAYIRARLRRKAEPARPSTPANPGGFGQAGNSAGAEKSQQSGGVSTNPAAFVSSAVLPAAAFRQTGLGRVFCPTSGAKVRHPIARNRTMRRIVALTLLAVVPLWAAGVARAAHCGACAYPQGAAAPEQCRMPQVQYRVCYRTVVEEQNCVCYRPVYNTVLQECRYTAYRPVYEQHVRECRQTCYRPVYEDYDVVRRYTVCRPVYEQHVRECRYTVCRPVWEEYQVPVRYCTYRPVYEQHVREGRYTICRAVSQQSPVGVRATS